MKLPCFLLPKLQLGGVSASYCIATVIYNLQKQKISGMPFLIHDLNECYFLPSQFSVLCVYVDILYKRFQCRISRVGFGLL